jgi:hypothetical protein
LNTVRRTRVSVPLFATSLLVFVFCAHAFAAIEGTVTNGTTGKPAAGDEITLIEFSQGMKEAARTKADAQGHFTFDVANTGGGMPRLVRATHQGVNYFKMVPPGTNSASVQVYESAKKVDGLTYNVETAYQTDSGALQCVQFYVVRNSATPPRTQAGDSGFEIALPENAKLEQSDVQSPGGQPIQTAPDSKGKGRYVYNYPLRPGETTFRILYTLPYSGELSFKPTLLHPVEQYAVITPSTMKFEAKNASLFTNQPQQGGVSVQIANTLPANTDLSYRISGNGQMPDNSTSATDQGGAVSGGEQATQDNRPGGGLGAPIDAPDPLTKYRWPILLGLGLMFVFGAFYIVTQRQSASRAAVAGEGGDDLAAPEASQPAGALQSVPSQNRSALLLDAMKEELFQLEVDHQQGNISADEYARAKAALDATLQRALKRRSGTASAKSV